jgi:hypothetical protein
MRTFVHINTTWASQEIDEAFIDPETVIGAKKKWLGMGGGLNYAIVLLLESGDAVVWAREWRPDWYTALHLLKVRVEL